MLILVHSFSVMMYEGESNINLMQFKDHDVVNLPKTNPKKKEEKKKIEQMWHLNLIDWSHR